MGVRERAANSLRAPAATVGWWHARRPYWPLQGSPGRSGVGAHRHKGQQGLQRQHPPRCPKASSVGCPRPPQPASPAGRARLWERDAVFAPGLRASLTLSCLSVGRARSRRLPGRLLQLRVTSAPRPGERCRGRWRLGRKHPELALGTPRLQRPPSTSVGPGDWQRSSCWCPHRHHCPPWSGAEEPSTPG